MPAGDPVVNRNRTQPRFQHLTGTKLDSRTFSGPGQVRRSGRAPQPVTLTLPYEFRDSNGGAALIYMSPAHNASLPVEQNRSVLRYRQKHHTPERKAPIAFGAGRL